MKFRWLWCVTMILAWRHSVGLKSLACYECAGLWEGEPEHPSLNNAACAGDDFNPANVTVTNSTSDPADPLFCFTFVVQSKDANAGRPYTIRGAQTKSNRSGLPFNTAIVNHIRNLPYSLDVDRAEVSSVIETCHEDLCNGSRTAFAARSLVLVALAHLWLRCLA